MDVKLGGQRSADSPRLLGAINDQVVLELLLERGAMTRSQIGQLTGLSKPTVSALLGRLTGRGMITTRGVVEGGPGPNAQIYSVDASAASVIGVHVEQRGCVAGLASLTGELLATQDVSVVHRRGSSPVDEIRSAVSGVLAAAGMDRDRVHRVVVGTPGVIDPRTGDMRHARHLQGWEAPGLLAEIGHELEMPVVHGNDVNLATVAEGVHGAARGHTDYTLLWLDRGVGLGLVLGGSLRTGWHGGAGEIGFLPVTGVDPAPRVDRGAAGAFQQLAGGQGIRALAKEFGIRGADPAAVVRAAIHAGRRGEPLLERLAGAIALGAAAVVTLVDPRLLVLGGPVALAGGEALASRIDAAMRRISFVRTEIAISQLTSDGVLQGAIEVALQDVRAQLFGRSAAALTAAR